MSVLQRYADAMGRGDINTCIDIEIDNELYGFDPELVTVGLQAIEQGKDAYDAIAIYRGAQV